MYYSVEHQGQNTGEALAVAKGLVRQVKEVEGNSPSTLYGK